MLQPLEAVLAALVVALGVALGASARERRRLRQRLMRAWVREHGATKVARAERQRGDALAARLALVESKALALREVAHAVAIAAQLDALCQLARWDDGDQQHEESAIEPPPGWDGVGPE